MNWECGCGVLNRDSKVNCWSCQSSKELGKRTPDGTKTAAGFWLNVLVGVVLIFLLVGVTIPSRSDLIIHGKAMMLIRSLEKYKKHHGTYPDNLDGFGDIQFCGGRKGPMGYRTHSGKTEFTLSCFGRGASILVAEEVWTVYSSKTKEWKAMSD